MPQSFDVTDKFLVYLRRALIDYMPKGLTTTHYPIYIDFEATKDKPNVHDCDREQTQLKTRYLCPDCKRNERPRCWTSGKGLFVMCY